MPGAGKTFLLMHIFILLAHFQFGPALWVARENAPLQSAAAYVDQLLPESSNPLKRRFARMLASTEPRATTTIDVLYSQRSDKQVNHEGLQVLLGTVGTLSQDARRLWPQLSSFHKATLLVFDEAQGFGRYEDGLVLGMLADDGLLFLIGDPMQPVGAAPTPEARACLHELHCRRVGLRSTAIQHAPAQIVQEVLLTKAEIGRAHV